MRSYLIVANQTLTGEALAAAMAERLAAGPASAHVVVPLTRVGGRLTWDEAASRAAAQARLEDTLQRLRDLGAEATGEIGDPDPVMAVRDAVRGRDIDELIVSTLPRGLSRWLGEVVPSRLRDAVRCPVTVVTQADTPSG